MERTCASCIHREICAPRLQVEQVVEGYPDDIATVEIEEGCVGTTESVFVALANACFHHQVNGQPYRGGNEQC